MGIKLNLDSTMILEKQFDGEIRGYSSEQVDKFLDIIIKDYKTIEANYLVKKEEVDKLKTEKDELEKKCSALEVENTRYKNQVGNIKPSNTVSAENFELMKKVSAYEKFLYLHGYDPKKIK